VSQSQAITRNKTRLIRSSGNLTYILGSRCSNGVVIIADRKFTIDQSGGIDSIYDSKLYGEFEGIITGFSGLRRRYENFIIEITDYVDTERSQLRLVPIRRFLMKARDIVKSMGSNDLDILIATRGSPSVLRHMYYDGGIETIKKYVVIGTGEPVGRFFLKKYWDENMDMNQVAELGYFIIKVIQKYNLEDTVGLSEKKEERESKPHIWLIPDNAHDEEASENFLNQLESHVNRRLAEMDKHDFFSEQSYTNDDPTVNNPAQGPSS
jgi:20S proteasome alpha/beta subunit